MKKTADLLIEIDRKYPSKEKKIVKSFVYFSRKKGLEYRLKSVLDELKRHLRQKEEKNTLYIQSAYHLSAETIEKIKELTKASKESKTEILINSSLRAGFIASWDEKIYNASLEEQIKKIKSKILCP
jgi:F0F1-type ATP synthase delta subunit